MGSGLGQALTGASLKVGMFVSSEGLSMPCDSLMSFTLETSQALLCLGEA